MSRTIINSGRRITFTPTVALKAGDFVYWQGYYGYVQDDVAAAALGTLILDAGVVELKNIFGSTLARGTKMFAAPTVMATTLLLYPAPSVPSGANPVGRVWATGVASSATATLRMAVFHPNAY